MLKAFGHKAPDTDAVCSAIVGSWYLNELHGIEVKPYILGAINRETEYVLNKAAVATPELLETLQKGDEVALFDTTNPEELPDLSESKVKSIIDHHKLGGVITSEPISITILPIASTCSVIYKMANETGHLEKMPKELKTLILASILSDTLQFRSPTTTDYDKMIAEKLAKELSIDIESFASEMFAAKSDLVGISIDEILKLDSKVFEIRGRKLRISVLETTKPENALSMLEDLKTNAVSLVKNEGVDDLLFFVIDILNGYAKAFSTSQQSDELIERAFKVKFEGQTALLPGVLSRKKQIIPALEEA